MGYLTTVDVGEIMYTVRIWNTESTNFNVNKFVRAHGTSLYTLNDRTRALRAMGNLIREDIVCKAEMEGPEGCLLWERCEIGEEPCECDGCGECDGDCEGCPGHDELEDDS